MKGNCSGARSPAPRTTVAAFPGCRLTYTDAPGQAGTGFCAQRRSRAFAPPTGSRSSSSRVRPRDVAPEAGSSRSTFSHVTRPGRGGGGAGDRRAERETAAGRSRDGHVTRSRKSAARLRELLCRLLRRHVRGGRGESATSGQVCGSGAGPRSRGEAGGGGHAAWLWGRPAWSSEVHNPAKKFPCCQASAGHSPSA